VYEIPGNDYQKILTMMDQLHELFLDMEKSQSTRKMHRARTLLNKMAEALVTPALKKIGRE
jgi:hypothetical protein